MNGGPRRKFLLLTLGAVSLSLAAASSAPLPGNASRFHSLSPELRALVERNRAELDRLPESERTRLRSFVARLGELSVLERSNAYLLIDRVQGLIETLPPDTRRRIESAEPVQRGAILERVMLQRLSRLSPPPALQDALQVSSLAQPSLSRAAVEVRLWRALSEPQRLRVTEMADPSLQRTAFIRMVRNDPRLNRLQAVILEEEDVRPLPVRRMDRPRIRALANGEVSRRAAELKLVRETPAPPFGDPSVTEFKQTLPPWLRATLDPLPPDAALRRVAILMKQAEDGVNEPGEQSAGDR